MSTSSRQEATQSTKIRELSYPFTWIPIYLFPALWIGSWGSSTYLSFFENETPGYAKWIHLGVLILSVVFMKSFMRHFAPFKTVHLPHPSPTSFLVSDYRTTIEIPFHQVDKVSGRRTGVNKESHRISLHLKRSTPFGTKITFIPTVPERRVKRNQKHPMVQELQTLIRSKPGKG